MSAWFGCSDNNLLHTEIYLIWRHLSCYRYEIFVVSIDNAVQLLLQSIAVQSQLIAEGFERSHSAVFRNERGGVKFFVFEFNFSKYELMINPTIFVSHSRSRIGLVFASSSPDASSCERLYANLLSYSKLERAALSMQQM